VDTTRPYKNAAPDRRDGGPRNGGPRDGGGGASDRGTPERPPREAPAVGLPGPWDHQAESFGAWLCRHRRVRGIELREIAEDSKIGMTYLQAFEDDRFDILPAPVFAKGFLRQYANYVGLDPEEVVNFYLSAAQLDQERAEEDLEAHAAPRRTDAPKVAGLVIGLVVAVLVLLWFLTTGDDGPPADETPPPAEVGAAVETGAGAAVETGAGDLTPADLAAADRAAADAAAGAAAGEPAAAAEPADSAPLRLTLDFSGECWVEVSVDGERRIAENKIQGESLVLRAEHAIDLKIGNVDVVEAELNGRPFRFTETAGTKVRNQRIDLETAAALGDPEARG
jgi:cytoskeleton protein RodZ